MEYNYTPGGEFPTGGGTQGPVFTNDSPPHGHDDCTPRGEEGPDFDPGPAIMGAGTEAYNAVIEGGGSHGDAMQAMGGACAQAAGELGIPAEDFNEAFTAFEEGFNTAQSEGGDAGTCINAGFDSANDATSDEMDMHPPADYEVTEPADFPAPGEGHIGHQEPVDLPEGMQHDWAEGKPGDEHPCNCHEEGMVHGPGPEMAPPLDADGNPIVADAYTGGGEEGMIPDMDMPMEGEGPHDMGEMPMAPPDPDGLGINDPAPMTPAQEAMEAAEAAEVAAQVAESTAAGDNGAVADDLPDGPAQGPADGDDGIT